MEQKQYDQDEKKVEIKQSTQNKCCDNSCDCKPPIMEATGQIESKKIGFFGSLKKMFGIINK